MEAGAHPENQGGGRLVREKKDYVGYVTALRKSSIFVTNIPFNSQDRKITKPRKKVYKNFNII